MRLLKTLPSSQSEHDLPESKLWFAVIVQALTDAAYAGNRREPLYNKREAIQWMKNIQRVFGAHMISITHQYIYLNSK